ncbi:MAG: hypothetical protein HQ567_29925, partial [Candidatus Nealsonbacteria bacterium]|nr:hypothetical protein [Candidatus Nealsonbacteria bacterium]
MRYATLTLILLSVLPAGCGRESTAPQPSEPEDYGKLPGLSRSKNQKLRDELERIKEGSGTPEQLDRTLPPEKDNVAAGLVTLFKRNKAKSILQRTERLFPQDRFKFTPLKLQDAIELRDKYDAQRKQARVALKRPQCDFGISHAYGFSAELESIEVVRVCAHLEAFHAADVLDAGKVSEAVVSLAAMLRLAECLGAEEHLDCRLHAAYIRGEAFRVLLEIVQHDRTTPVQLSRLQTVVQKQLESWPADADAWIGERAMGMHAYEMVRNGDFHLLLLPEEIAEFGEEASLREVIATTVRNVDRDELYYLETMCKIIDTCREPFYRRAETLESIARDLQERQDADDFSTVAARLLLRRIGQGQEIQTQDRANWEAWALALAMATGSEIPPYKLNPLTGEEYRRARLDKSVVVEKFG